MHYLTNNPKASQPKLLETLSVLFIIRSEIHSHRQCDTHTHTHTHTLSRTRSLSRSVQTKYQTKQSMSRDDWRNKHTDFRTCRISTLDLPNKSRVAVWRCTCPPLLSDSSFRWASPITSKCHEPTCPRAHTRTLHAYIRIHILLHAYLCLYMGILLHAYLCLYMGPHTYTSNTCQQDLVRSLTILAVLPH